MSAADEADLDDRHHALGRPAGRHVTPYRNRYVIDRDCDQAARMRASPAWREIGTMNGGKDSIFVVTPAGIAEVWLWLEAKNRKDGVRPYFVTAEGIEPRVVVAKSRSAARFALWRDLSDAWSDATFKDFVQQFDVRATVARPAPPVVEIPF